MSTDNKKIIFNEKLQILIESSNERSYFIDNVLYNTILAEVKEAKMLLKDKRALTLKHYRRLKRWPLEI